MNEKFDYIKSLRAFVEMYNEQQNKIKSILDNAVSSISVNSLQISNINLPQIANPQIDIEPLEKMKKAFSNIDTSGFDIIGSTAEKLANLCDVFTDDFKNFLSNAGITIRENLFFNLSVLGEFEWCYLEIEELDSDLLDLAPSCLKEYLADNEPASIKDIDAYITKFFTKKIIGNIADRTILNLDVNDKRKLEQAMVDFRAGRYLDCANLLASLIDAQSIKQELYDMKNNKYRDVPANISQGWQAFSIVFYNDLAGYFDGKDFKAKRGDNQKREEKFEIFMEEIKNDLSDYETKMPILLLASCLIKFFENSNWENYPQKPEVINRHWLMHGMYDIDDIAKPDCVKLLLMLNQLVNIYAKLRNGEL